MITLTAYGIRKANKAYKKHKAEKELQKGEALNITDPSSELRTSQDKPRPVSGGVVNYASSTSTGTSREQDRSGLLSPSSQSRYSESVYSNTSSTSPVTDFRQYQQYVERQSHGYLKDTDAPPSYDTVVSQYQPPRQDFNLSPHPTATPPILANSPYLSHSQFMRYFSGQEEAAQMQMQNPSQPQYISPTQHMGPTQHIGTTQHISPTQPTSAPISAVSELPDTGTYRFPAGAGPEPLSAACELPAEVPMPLRVKHTPNGQEGPARFELPTTDEEIERSAPRQRQDSQRKRHRSRSGSSREEDSERKSLHEGDLAKTFDLS